MQVAQRRSMYAVEQNCYDVFYFIVPIQPLAATFQYNFFFFFDVVGNGRGGVQCQ